MNLSQLFENLLYPVFLLLSRGTDILVRFGVAVSASLVNIFGLLEDLAFVGDSLYRLAGGGYLGKAAAAAP